MGTHNKCFCGEMRKISLFFFVVVVERSTLAGTMTYLLLISSFIIN